ncbi:MAG: hypothetical protein OXH50_15655, partial [Gemmatimonadetes bacterium]|nr:hypothetical protein [Gemmatimonadota bacterium]
MELDDVEGGAVNGPGTGDAEAAVQDLPPVRDPFCDPVVTENPLVPELLERVWGTDDIEIDSYSSNCPAPGTEYQNWHRDGMLLA